MYTLSVNVWFQKLIRQFFFAIDKIVFNFISTMYDLLISIARTSILTQADILDMADRVYKFLALFMAFKVIFSLITYVVNPDEFSDKSKGVSKLGINIIISLSLLVITPYLFRYAYQIQTIILEDNSLAVLIFGEDKLNNEKNFINSAGDNMAYITMMAFYNPDTSLDVPGTTEGLSECTNLLVKDSSGKLVTNEACFGIDQSTISNLTDINQLNSASKGLLKIATDSKSTLTVEDVVNYANGVAINSLGLMFRQDLTLATDADGNFVMEYKYLFSTAVGVIIILLLITFCMDVGLRSIKLAFYQLIAPIPILSYVDPKSGKDGMFKKWYDACFKTFLSLFIRLLALYFAVYIINRIGNMTDIITGARQSQFFVKVFIIIGALMFAKDFPKILEGLGIKLDAGGKLFLNPFKKFEEQAIGGKKILGGAKGLVAGTAMGVAGMASGAGLSRGAAGMWGGLKAGVQGKKMGEIRKEQARKNAMMRRAIASGSSWGERLEARASNFLGLPGRLGRIEHDIQDTQNQKDNLDAEKQTREASIAPRKNLISKRDQVKTSLTALESFVESQIEGNKAGAISAEYRRRKATHQYLQNNMGQSLTEAMDLNGHHYDAGSVITAEMVADADNDVGYYLKKVGKKELMTKFLNHDSSMDAAAQSLFDSKRATVNHDIASFNDAYDAVGDSSIARLGISERTDDYDSLHGEIDSIEIVNGTVRESIRNKELEIEELARQSQALGAQLQHLSAQKKDATASRQAIGEFQDAGPARPGSITPASSVPAYRSRGMGTGYMMPGMFPPGVGGPMPPGPGPGTGGPGPGPGPGTP